MTVTGRHATLYKILIQGIIAVTGRAHCQCQVAFLLFRHQFLTCIICFFYLFMTLTSIFNLGVYLDTFWDKVHVILLQSVEKSHY